MLATIAAGAAIAASAPSQTELTVYNDGYALVKDRRTIDMHKGVFSALVEDVAQQIEANSVAIRPVDGAADFTVLEQNYKYDLFSVNAILNKAVGGMIKIHQNGPNGTRTVIRGKLLSAPTAMISDANGNQSQVYNGMVVQTESGQILLNPEGTVEVETMPAGFVSKPSLVWLLNSVAEGPQNVELSYLTRGMGWKSDYVLSLNKEGTKGDLKGWVTLTNNSGTSFTDAKLKLLAGEVNRAPVPTLRYKSVGGAAMSADMAKSTSEETFGEYHLYTVLRPTTVGNNEIKQVSLLEGSGVSVTKKLLIDSMSGYYGYYPSEGEVGTGSIKPIVYLELKNSKENGLGVPLPAGTFKVFQTSQSGSLEMLGEDAIVHTPKDEKISLKVGKAFDIVADRKRLNFTRINDREVQETFSIEIRNRKETPETVTVWERHWGDHKVTQSNMTGTWLDSNTLEFIVKLLPNETKTVTYIIDTKW